MDERIGVIGLGRMGRAISKRLAGNGSALTGWTRSGVDPGIPGLAVARRIEDAVAACDLLILSLFDDAAVSETLDRLSRLDLSGRLVVEMSTISPDVVRAAAPALKAAGARIVDAPISGGPEMVAAGTIGLFVGGAPEDVARFAPVAARLTSLVFEVGPLGTGHAAKIVNNTAMGGAWQAMIESFRLGVRLGLDLPTMLRIMETSPATPPGIRARIPKMRGEDMTVGFSVAGILKDQDLFLAAAEAVGEPLPALAAARGNFRKVAKAGHAEADLAMVVPIRSGQP